MEQDHLPMARGRKRQGRHRKALGAYARAVRQTLGRVPAIELRLSRMAGLADQLDLLERDPSPFNFKGVSAQLLAEQEYIDGLMAQRAPDDASALFEVVTGATHLGNP